MTNPEAVEALVERLSGLLAKVAQPPWRVEIMHTNAHIHQVDGLHWLASCVIGHESWHEPEASEGARYATLIVEAINALPTLLAALSSAPVAEEGWKPIDTAPKDGTRFYALHRSPYRGESRTETVWWQPEFEAFISSCREMVMAPGYTINGKDRELHSPEVFLATHWLCAVPPLPELAASTPKDTGERGPVR